jgi:hypothetical protein
MSQRACTFDQLLLHVRSEQRSVHCYAYVLLHLLLLTSCAAVRCTLSSTALADPTRKRSKAAAACFPLTAHIQASAMSR